MNHGRSRDRGGNQRHRPVQEPAEAGELFWAKPAGAAVGLRVAHHGRIGKVGRSHARAMLVEAAWATAKSPGPLHAFFVRIRARRGHQIAAVAVARKLTVLCWHLLTKGGARRWLCLERPDLSQLVEGRLGDHRHPLERPEVLRPAQSEAKIEPDGLLDDDARKAVASI